MNVEQFVADAYDWLFNRRTTIYTPQVRVPAP